MNRLWRRLGVFLAAVTVAVPVESAAPAFASTVDEVSWASCQARSTGSMSFGATILDWLDGTQLTYSASVARDCFTNTSLEIVELTPQLNDKPQRYLLAWRAFGPYDGTMPVTPLRTLRWSLRLVNPLGTKDLATVDVTVNQPQGALQLPAGVTDVTIASSSVAERRRFVHAVKTPNLPVRIPGNLDLDLSGLNEVFAPGVQILGDRSQNRAGPRLFTTTFPLTLFHIPPYSSNSRERISGIRLDGGEYTDPFDDMGDEDNHGIRVEKPNVEIDHNEIYLWRGSGVSVFDRDNQPGLIDMNNGNTIRIHDNYIHDDLHPTGDICCGHGGGYGVETVHGAYALVDQNVFDGNRHSIAGDGRSGSGYFFYRNLILTGGGVNSRISQTHQIDMHGLGCAASECGQAGEYMDIEYNTVWYHSGVGVKLRGTPVLEMDVRHNVFAHPFLFTPPPIPPPPSGAPALVQNESGLVQSDNLVNVPVGGDARTTCDFDVDGTADTFHATGASWWFQSSALGGRYVYLNTSTASGSAIQLGDTNHDGLCDVTANGQTFRTDPATVLGGPAATMPFLVTSTESDAGSYIAGAGLTVGSVSRVQSSTPAGWVIGQDPAWGTLRPVGWPVNFTVSTGEVTVPAVLSLNQTEAENAIVAAGLPVGDESFTNNCVDPGSVQNQNPSGGVRVPPGTPVNLTISTCTGGGGSGGGGIEK